MEYLGDLIKIILPAALVIYAVYLVFGAFSKKEKQIQQAELKLKSREIAFPIRLQAYERLILFLERVSLPNLISRTEKNNLTALIYYTQIVAEIRDEYNHNLSQQVYVSDKAWDLLTGAKERTIAFMNQAFPQVDAESDARGFAKLLLDKYIADNQDFTSEAIQFLKNEIRELY